MTKPRVLISDKMDPNAARIFTEMGCDVDVITGETPEQLIARIGDYDGLAIRSSTKVTKEILAAAKNLKVIGRAGIGVDNVDIPAASAQGVVVMNTPFGNSITTAEHAIALMFALARQIPEANAQTQAGKWPKNDFMGVEVTGKTLGLIGAGNIGSIVASRAIGLRMKVVAFDPFLTPERAVEMGVEKVDLDTLLARADFITLHTPLTDQTRNILSKENLAKTKKGVRIINCARGGLVDEAALKEAMDAGHVAGAALDVFQTEPAKESPLFGTPNFICTPHLGASTTEAQVNVALQVAEQMADYLLTGAVTNSLNMPNVSAEDAPKLAPGGDVKTFIGKRLDWAFAPGRPPLATMDPEADLWLDKTITADQVMAEALAAAPPTPQPPGAPVAEAWPPASGVTVIAHRCNTAAVPYTEETLAAVELGLLCGTPGLAALGVMVASLTAGLRRGGALAGLLMLPLAIPLIIFGAGSIGDFGGGAVRFLAASSLFLVAVAP